MTPGILAAIVAISTISTAAFSPAQQRGREIKWVNADIADMKGLTHHVLNSQSMGHEVGYVVWTPPEYDQDRQTRYPVVYFLHGAGGSEKSDSAGFSSRVSAAIRSGKFPSAICVFPNGGMSGYRNDVESMIVDELIPRIDRSYRTLPAAESRVVCGFSMGGAGSVHLSLRHPDLFCAAGSWGGALSFRGRADESPLLEIAKENAGQLKTHQYALLTINGDQDRPDAFQPLKEILTSQGISHHVITLKDTNHNLGKYYELAGDAMLEFLAERLSADEPFQIEESVIAQSHGELHWSQSRPALIPGNPSRVIVTTQEIEREGSHGYRNVYFTETTDGANSWSEPKEIISLRRRSMPEGHDLVIGDVCPQWHAATGVVLAHGKTFGFDMGVKENRGYERVSYAVYSPRTKQWSGLNLLELPDKDHDGNRILEPNSGCNQRFDLPNGEILLPIRYRKHPKSRQYTTIVARCRFDGEKLTYIEHGSELTFAGRRGLYEPSVIGHGGRFYLTMRADESAFVSVSDDGLNYSEPAEWKFDDGEILGSYNAQQHWITHDEALYLAYTRRGANNDHVFRNRAPLFIARVDPDALRVIRSTERVLMSETGLDLAGGFGVVDFSPAETWVVSTEMAFPEERRSEPNRIRLSRIIWQEANR